MENPVPPWDGNGSTMQLMHIFKAIKTMLAIMMTVVMMGCQAFSQTPLASRAVQVDTEPGAPAYYYFSAAQMKLLQGDNEEAIWHLRQALKYDPQSAYLRIELAQLLLVQKDVSGAFNEIQNVLAQYPQHVKALILKGRILTQQNNLAGAKAAYEKVLSRDPTEQTIYLRLGRIYWDEGDLENADRIFGQMVVHFPDYYAAHYFHGKVLSARGEFARAEKALRQSLVLEPSLEESRQELVKIYKQQNQPKRLIQVYIDLLKYHPDNIAATLQLAEQYHVQGDDTQANQLLYDLGERVQHDSPIVSSIFETYLEPKQYKMALWILSRLLRAAPNHSELNYLAGLAAGEMDRPETALRYLEKVAPKSRFYQNAVIQTALIHHEAGHLDKAIIVIKRAIGHAPDQSDYYLYLGSFYEELERHEDALQSFKQGVANDRHNPKLYFRMGVVYDRLGRKQESIKVMRRVLQLAPNDAEALNYLGYTYADLGINLDEAEMLIQSALKIKPEDGYISDSMGWVYYKQGLFGEALHWLKKAVALVPDDPIILEHLGDVYLKMDSKQKALNFYQRSLDKKEKDRDSLEKKIRSLAAPNNKP